MHPNVLAGAGGVAVVLYFFYSLSRWFFSSTRAVPGPFLARFTDLWYFERVRAGNFEHTNQELHKRFGPIVRYGPNRYSFNDPESTKIIYAHGTQFEKSSWYDASAVPGTWNLFADRHIKRHAQNRRLYQSSYSMSSLIHYEPYVDDCAEVFEQRLLEFSAAGIPINMGHWFQCYAFDVIGKITFADRLGFLNKGQDIGNVISALEDLLKISAFVGIYPSIYPYLAAFMSYVKGPGGVLYVSKYTEMKIEQHKAQPKAIEEGSTVAEPFVSKYLRQHANDPNTFTKYHILQGCNSNMAAGSDTTAITLSAILYHLLKNPRTLKALRGEISTFQEQGKLSKAVTFKQSQDMPYLQAVIKEALRLHPAVGFPLERVVPEGGVTLCGTFFPPGTIVGVNAWVQHRNPDLFGEDADMFKPERWLTEDADKLSLMNRYWMPFGLGSRTCIGRHISMLEICKLIPRIIRDFDFQLDGALADPNTAWKTSAYFFVKPRDFNVLVTPRQHST